ncbi:serine hydrolase [Fusobacterium sp.]|uniref:serine hydrolase n=1 Tax=Fusobacterium sp. TaxID=68766 RepID=UPI0029045D55|nr:serine hydrolase [Fusobacterium sp.]MDU1910945.1 serine hydrolase [Fusobacterium sp.]
MEKRIREIISENSGITGIIIRDSFGKTIMINEEKVFPSASLIKLFILMALKKEDYNKKIKLKKDVKVGGCGVLKVMEDGLPLTIKDIAYLMICLSDNTATNILIDYIGMERINENIKENGFVKTILGRKMMDTKAREAGKDNFTTPKDVLGVLEILCKNPDDLDMLRNQAYSSKIPLYFPREVDFAHKTGELMYIEHDAGRLFFDGGWVDIIILTKDLEKNEDGIKINSLIGKVIFDNYCK